MYFPSHFPASQLKKINNNLQHLIVLIKNKGCSCITFANICGSLTALSIPFVQCGLLHFTYFHHCYVAKKLIQLDDHCRAKYSKYIVHLVPSVSILPMFVLSPNLISVEYQPVLFLQNQLFLPQATHNSSPSSAVGMALFLHTSPPTLHHSRPCILYVLH